jgi:hypothetical protein
MLQERLGMLLFWPDTREKGELLLQKQFAKLSKYGKNFSKRTVYIALHYVLVKFRAFAIFIQRKIDKQLVHLVNLIKGRQRIDARGKASHFLHDITRFKDKFRRQ